MRSAGLVALVAFGLAAYAQEGELLAPRVRVPGESAIQKQLSVNTDFLRELEMVQDDIDSVKETVKKLNNQRAALLEQLDKARADLLAAQEKLNGVVAELGNQETVLHKYIQDRLGGDQRADYPVRVQLQPVIDWLKLTKEQVTDLVAKQRALLATDPRAQLAEAYRALKARPAGQPLTTDQRKPHIDLLKKCADFNQTWLKNIESVLTTDEQKQLWNTRYRRTRYPLGGGI